MKSLRFLRTLILLNLCCSSWGLAAAQTTFQPKEFLPERLINALEWRDEVHRIEDGAPAWQLCRMCAADASDSLEAQISYLEFLREVNAAVREAVGFVDVPIAPDANPKVRDPSDGLRGAVIVHPSQDSALVGFYVYRLRIEGEDWFVDTVGLSAYPDLNEQGEMIKADCDATHKLTNREKSIILRAGRPHTSLEPVTGNRHRGAVCMDGSPTISEISFVPGRWKENTLNSKIFIRQCGADDSITQFNKTIMALGSIDAPLRHCIRSTSNQ